LVDPGVLVAGYVLTVRELAKNIARLDMIYNKIIDRIATSPAIEGSKLPSRETALQSELIYSISELCVNARHLAEEAEKAGAVVDKSPIQATICANPAQFIMIKYDLERALLIKIVLIDEFFSKLIKF